jgi:glutaminyl-peptide cyclotransferase
MRKLFGLLLLAFMLGSAGCNNGPATNVNSGANKPANAPAGQVPVYGYEVVNTYPHDKDAFTQGLIFDNGALLESTGLEKYSTLRRVELQTGKVLQKIDVPPFYFAEGMTLFNGKIYQLTWKAEKGFIYDPQTFQKTGEFPYTGEGWGLTHDAESLILSDGSDKIRFLDPNGFQVRRTISVTDAGVPVISINELEYVKGEILANIWPLEPGAEKYTDKIARIDPQTGQVKGWIDMKGLLKPGEITNQDSQDAVLNGIAYDEQGDRLFVTGKLWPKLFEVRIKQK